MGVTPSHRYIISQPLSWPPSSLQQVGSTPSNPFKVLEVNETAVEFRHGGGGNEPFGGQGRCTAKFQYTSFPTSHFQDGDPAHTYLSSCLSPSTPDCLTSRCLTHILPVRSPLTLLPLSPCVTLIPTPWHTADPPSRCGGPPSCNGDRGAVAVYHALHWYEREVQ